MKGFDTLTMQDLEPDPVRGGYRLKHGNNSRNTLSVSPSDAQPDSCHESMGTQETAGLDGRCHLSIHSKRHRLTDPGGARCYKYIIDALVSARVLTDDSPRYIKEPVLSTQEKIPTNHEEETIITLTWEEEIR